jgi:hypothetical protein
MFKQTNLIAALNSVTAPKVIGKSQAKKQSIPQKKKA